MPGLNAKLGTRWQSITSTWCQSAPAVSIAAISSAKALKLAESKDGATMGMGQDYRERGSLQVEGGYQV